MTNPIGLPNQRNRSLPQVVYKYRVMIGGSLQVYWPPGTRVTLSRVAPDDVRAVEFWLAHTAPTRDLDLDELWVVDLSVCATGQVIPGNFEVVSTCVDPARPAVWHLVSEWGN